MTSSLLHVVDASVPPEKASDLPDGTVGIMGYLGAEGRTPHIWTVDEWRRFEHLMQLGIWVVDFQSDPVTEAKKAANAAHDLGWFGLDRRGILLDCEAVSDGAFVGELGLKVREYGYAALAYESTSVLNANPRLDGVVLAQPNDPPHVPAGQLIIGRQYKWDVPCGNTQIDLDVFDSSAEHLFGRGPRK